MVMLRRNLQNVILFQVLDVGSQVSELIILKLLRIEC
jgi:hypothetical protein